MDSSYISHFRDSTPSFFLHSYLNYIELLSILRQNIGGEKMKREDEIENEIQYAYCPNRIPRIVDGGYVKQYLKIMIFEYQYCLLQNYCVILHTIKLG